MSLLLILMNVVSLLFTLLSGKPKPKMYSSRKDFERSSSVSVRTAPGANGDLCGNNTGNYLPLPRSQSRISVASSAWDSLRLSVQNLSKAAMNVFMVAPCSRHRCCIGCVSLRDAVPLICVAELVVIGLCTLIAVDFYVTDGRLFYTREMEGEGTTIAVAFAVFLAISLPVIIFTLTVWHYRKPYLYVVHVLWQWTVLEMMLYFAYNILERMFSEEVRRRTGFLLPSAVVLSIGSIIAVWVQSWWLFVFVDAMFFESTSSKRRSKRRRSTSANEYGCKSGDHYEEDSVGTDSRRPSFTIPVVKVDRTKSLETASLGGPRKATLSKMDDIPETGDVIDL
ncbi:hypothetical protein Y032_0020g159 [Ancylostoma ceylanicum]|uniref:Uncharacterized protein n=1 Tax=Ancylostoma ceylanicum TaxID=53326 RepID=A0A016UZX6_9BILA|nr:hypothetical protein Y032_0020g159 [Ancylostoma ceylanicum]